MLDAEKYREQLRVPPQMERDDKSCSGQKIVGRRRKKPQVPRDCHVKRRGASASAYSSKDDLRRQVAAAMPRWGSVSVMADMRRDR